MSKKRGWYGDSRRHALAAKGISTKPTSPMARMGENNGRWSGGNSKTYYRRIAGCETNDGKLVHHKDMDLEGEERNYPSNLEVIEPTKGMNAIGVHNQKHPEKGRKNRKSEPQYVIYKKKLTSKEMKKKGLVYDGWGEQSSSKKREYYYIKKD